MSEMDNSNPYASPNANVARDPGQQEMGTLIEGGRSVDSGRGAAWISEGFQMFMKAPGMWIVVVLVYMVMAFVVSLIPFLGSIAMALLGPVFGAGMLLGCQALDRGEPLEIGHLFAGFKENVGQLVLVGLLAFVAIFVVAMVAGVIMGIMGGAGLFAMMAGGHTAAGGLAFVGVAIAGLVFLALMVPVSMAAWYAPALVVFHQQDAIAALKQSFAGCMKNIVPFLIWGVIAFVLSIVAAIPFGLGFLVLGPVLLGSLYYSYREIFCA
ncbi:MAG TPA: BPSS1780 family membrane protein [Burkholderiales bacterium]